MATKIKVKEKTAAIWSKLLISSSVMIIVGLALFLLIDDRLLSSIFKLVAFTGFALAIISLLQKQGKSRIIELELTRQNLVVNYFLKSKKNQEELFDLDTIRHIKKVPAPPVWHIFRRKECAKFIISFTDTSTKLSLFRFQGQDRFISQNDATKVEHFLAENLPL